MITKLFKEKTITEMPYVHYQNKIFDLEFENFKSVEDILNFLDLILSGESFKDKYKNHIELHDKKSKLEFISHLKEDAIFKNIFNHKFSNRDKQMFDIMVSNIR